MKITIPQRLTYPQLQDLIAEHYEASLLSSETCLFDWKAAEWALLPEIVSVLLWSTKLVQLKKEVRWTFADPRTPLPGREHLREVLYIQFGRSVVQSAAHRIEDLRERALRGELYPRQIQARIRELVQSLSAHPAASHWLEQETGSLRSLYFHGYLKTYDVFRCAVEAGIHIEPHPATLPKARMDRDETGPCLALRPIPGIPEVDALVGELCDPAVLETILGTYANLEVADRGALARILIAETGRNVSEHARASAAWACTRLVNNPKVVGSWTANDPSLAPFRESGHGFLEIVIADNGDGLTNRLDAVLERDPRDVVRQKYPRQADGGFAEEHIVDYAFDRLSSTKRDVHQLLHWEQAGNISRALASGLYWVWNVVRSYQGVLSIRTGHTCGWYDLSEATAATWEATNLKVDNRRLPFAGTMIRLCFPVSGSHATHLSRAVTQLPTYTLNLSPSHTTAKPITTRVSWVGNLARNSSPRLTRGKPRKHADSRQLQLLPPSQPTELLEDLRKQHASLADGDILLLDLCGMREQWQKDQFDLLCRFFLEMNYTAPVGRSTVVLWNVPESAQGPIEQGLRIIGEQFSHLMDVRRAIMWVRDNGDVHFFCGWREAEELLPRLAYTPELDFDELGTTHWDSAERERLARVVRENSHLFTPLGPNRVALRASAFELWRAAWYEALRWLDGLLDRDFSKQGVRLRHPHSDGFYRLPSTGYLVKQFYSFAGQAADRESCARLSWMLAQVIRGVETTTGKKAIAVISVTRSTTGLLRDQDLPGLLQLQDRVCQRVAAATLEDLARVGREKNLEGPAVLVTDVISTGTLCEQVARALPKVEWLATLAILDIREEPLSTDKANARVDFAMGVTCVCSKSLATGPVYSLAQRNEPKFDPAEVPNAKVIGIDPITVCPIRLPGRFRKASKPLWPLLAKVPQALQVGHFGADEFHHYIYYVNGLSLLKATDPLRDGRTLLDLIVDSVVQDLRKFDHQPEHTLILHPTRDVSYAADIAEPLQKHTGALYRYELYRDTFAGQRRFSTFASRGLPGRLETVILVDDGSNSGDTLLALLHAAVICQPRRILAYLALTRMPPFKLDLLSRLGRLNLGPRRAEVSITHYSQLCIPVYSRRTCPVCRFRDALADLERQHTLLSRYARSLKEDVSPVRTSSKAIPSDNRFPWRFASAKTTSRFREALELSPYETRWSRYVVKCFQEASFTPAGTVASRGRLLDIAFVICAEPELVEAPIFGPHLSDLFNAICAVVPHCLPEHTLTLFGAGFHLLAQYTRKPLSGQERLDASLLVQGLLGRHDTGVLQLGRLFALLLAQSRSEPDSETSTTGQVCGEIAQAFLNILHGRNGTERGLVRLFARLYARIFLANLDPHVGWGPFQEEVAADSCLFGLAAATAGMFWHHAVDHVTLRVGIVRDLARSSGISVAEAESATHLLVLAFDKLVDLQERLSHVEGTQAVWQAAEIRGAMTSFGDALARFAETLDAGDASLSRENVMSITEDLRRSTDHLLQLLETAFAEVFPRPFDVVDGRMNEWYSHVSPDRRPKLELKPAPDLPATTEVFLPRVLLSRFLSVAFDNLLTRAFHDWSSENITTRSRVHVEIRRGLPIAGEPTIAIRVVDNGPEYRQAPPPAGTSTGLESVRTLIQPFEAQLDGPIVDGVMTYVELTMKHRTTGDSP
jgi:hypothetical protein